MRRKPVASIKQRFKDWFVGRLDPEQVGMALGHGLWPELRLPREEFFGHVHADGGVPPKMSEIEWDLEPLDDQFEGYWDTMGEQESVPKEMDDALKRLEQGGLSLPPWQRPTPRPTLAPLSPDWRAQVKLCIPYQQTDHAVCPYCLTRLQDKILGQMCCYQIEALYWKAITGFRRGNPDRFVLPLT